MADKCDAMTLIHGEFWYSEDIQGYNSMQPVIIQRCSRQQLLPARDALTCVGDAGMSCGSIVVAVHWVAALMLVSTGTCWLVVA